MVKEPLTGFWIRARVSMLIFTVLFATVVIACSSTSELEYPTMTPKRSARFALHDKFLEAMPVRNREVLQSLTSDSAFQQIEQWFNMNPSLDCDFVKLEYKSRTFGLSRLENPEGVRIGFEIIVPCRGSGAFSRKGNYHLIVEDVVIRYLSSGWQIESIGSITERMVKRS